MENYPIKLPNPVDHTKKSAVAVGVALCATLWELGEMAFFSFKGVEVSIPIGLVKMLTPIALGTLEVIRQLRLSDKAWKIRDSYRKSLC